MGSGDQVQDANVVALSKSGETIVESVVAVFQSHHSRDLILLAKGSKDAGVVKDLGGIRCRWDR